MAELAGKLVVMDIRYAFAGAVAVAATWGAVLELSPAAAQTFEQRLLTEEIERLKKDVSDLQKEFYRGNVPAQGALLPPAQAAADTAARAGRIEVRLGQFEDELRGLTGKVEEAAHDIGELATRLDTLIADVDVRLAAIERGLAERARLASAPATAPPVTPPRARQPGTLGTISTGQPAPAGTAPVIAALPPALPPGTPKQQYDYAFGLLRQAEYAEAERALSAFIGAHPDDALTGNAYYWLAETFYVRRDYEQAARHFARGYLDFPDSVKAPDNLVKLGMSLANLGKTDEACRTFSELGDRFPNASPSITQLAATQGRRAGCS